MSDEVKVYDRTIHADARGSVEEGIKRSEVGHIEYVYRTTCYPGVVKSWHRHAEHTDRLWCVSGMARVVTCRLKSWAENELQEAVAKQMASLPEGQRFEAPEMWPSAGRDFHEFVIGPLAPKVVVIPPGWWHGFQALGGQECVIINAPDMAYDPDDEERLPIGAIPFPWREVDG